MEEFSRVLKVQHHFIHTSEGVRETSATPASAYWASFRGTSHAKQPHVYAVEL